MTDIVRDNRSAGLPTRSAAVDRVFAAYMAAYADNTQRAYARAVAGFVTYLGVADLRVFRDHDATFFAGAICEYATGLPFRWVTINQIVCGILAGIEFACGVSADAVRAVPRFQTVMRGVRRMTEESPNRMSPFSADHIRRVSEAWDGAGDLPSLKRRAGFLLACSTGLRRSELVALRTSDVEIADDGIRIRLGKTKTDKIGGQRIGTRRREGPHCAVAALERMMAAAGPTDYLLPYVNRWGAVAPSVGTADKWVARLAKTAAVTVGEDAACYSGHSFRATLATLAFMNGADIAIVAAALRHSSIETTRRYMRQDPLDRDPASFFPI